MSPKMLYIVVFTMFKIVWIEIRIKKTAFSNLKFGIKYIKHAINKIIAKSKRKYFGKAEKPSHKKHIISINNENKMNRQGKQNLKIDCSFFIKLILSSNLKFVKFYSLLNYKRL